MRCCFTFLLSSFFLLTSCSDDSGNGGAIDAGSGTDAAAAIVGGDRPVSVYVPTSYSEGTPMPLVILLHGFTASGELQEQYFQIEKVAEERGFLYVTPDGTKNTEDDRFWNATDACCDFGDSNVDDSAYLRGLVDEIKGRFTVDERRVYFMGHSNGGFMSYRMACEHADAIAGIVSLAGAMFADTSQCKPSEPVSVLQIHGTMDEVIVYDGGQIFEVNYPSALETVNAWAALNGCEDTQTTAEAIDLDSSLAGNESEVIKLETGCSPGGHAELWTIVGGAHSPILGAEFAGLTIDFLFAHPKPEATTTTK